MRHSEVFSMKSRHFMQQVPMRSVPTNFAERYPAAALDIFAIVVRWIVRDLVFISYIFDVKTNMIVRRSNVQHCNATAFMIVPMVRNHSWSAAQAFWNPTTFRSILKLSAFFCSVDHRLHIFYRLRKVAL